MLRYLGPLDFEVIRRSALITTDEDLQKTKMQLDEILESLSWQQDVLAKAKTPSRDIPERGEIMLLTLSPQRDEKGFLRWYDYWSNEDDEDDDPILVTYKVDEQSSRGPVEAEKWVCKVVRVIAGRYNDPSFWLVIVRPVFAKRQFRELRKFAWIIGQEIERRKITVQV
jgi:hypothetical protein